VGDLHGASQAKLLRVLQEGEFHRVGGERLTRESVPVEIRMQREPGVKSTIQEARESAEREHVLRALGMERTNLHKRIRALGLSRGK
jgi:two-component system nitrogen regulation response regulator NtrX